ncbi:MAG: imidazole glycerol phosphate synthase subunit HisF [Flavobacteriales bacterium CG03_land_8_20_14_0_80_35_15]|nr:MAG: imidazole glycerol phosphate synthase cyclase subunit [Bacteroidetes bacterium CG2_30_33_31]PIV19154.1 MAG: imidazole glycerol phosphate synthase subunit HisF [Flavobacteriales bacterium CG03_land_8_20_14_0_80_35_15]PJA04515.1 MAG: imidazole glycerol phosphate synthase subunit HisF [Flavobacteriales bacterium CG_4_10_14_0_2_um_filter_35_18]
MKTIRIIPRLDIKGPNLVKGIHLEGLRVLGKPEDFARYYYENGADELFFQDTVASLYDRNSLRDIITKTAKEIFIPLTVGGGLRTIDDIRNVLRAGADKVAINTAAIKNPQFIREASLKFGSSTIVVAIEAIKGIDGKYFAFTDNGREYSGLEVVSWARKAEELGAGEIVITSVDKEGTGEGYDIELIRFISEAVSIPVIAHGGASSPADVVQAIQFGKADAVAIASILHYSVMQTFGGISSDYKLEGNITFLNSGKIPKKISPSSLKEIRAILINAEIPTRI